METARDSSIQDTTTPWSISKNGMRAPPTDLATKCTIRSLKSHPLTQSLQTILFGVHFAESRLVSRALTSFYGIGPTISQRLMAKFHIHQTARVGALAEKQVTGLAEELSSMTLENDLRRQLRENIRRLKDMGSYRGRRHAMGLPVRGQRTRSQVSFFWFGDFLGKWRMGWCVVSSGNERG